MTVGEHRRPGPGIPNVQPNDGDTRSISQSARLLAVCGLSGGAGASTMSYLIARHSAASAPGAVLVCDMGAIDGGLSALAAAAAAHSLPELSRRVAQRLPLADDLYVVDARSRATDRELHVIATGPQLPITGARDALRELLVHARGAHRLTVVDCGTLQRPAQRLALTSASHVAWIVPATVSGVHTATRVLAAIGARIDGHELVVARRDPSHPRAPLKALRTLAGQRHAPVLLIPRLPDPVRAPDQALDDAGAALDPLHEWLSR